MKDINLLAFLGARIKTPDSATPKWSALLNSPAASELLASGHASLATRFRHQRLGLSGLCLEICRPSPAEVGPRYGRQSCALVRRPVWRAITTATEVNNSADYVLCGLTLNQTGANLPADGNSNGRVDAADFDFWRSRLGNPSGSGLATAAAVPEPASITLVFAAACRKSIAF